ncbi:MAG: hypothetical protein JWP44_894 [Mucilaginibacter sp.]|nr:hypothetical protein [Mucilaginibacter sp.]
MIWLRRLARMRRGRHEHKSFPKQGWGLKKVNLGSTKDEILKNLEKGDLLVFVKKGGIHHAGVYSNGEMYNSHGTKGPDFTDYKHNNSKSQTSNSACVDTQIPLKFSS